MVGEGERIMAKTEPRKLRGFGVSRAGGPEGWCAHPLLGLNLTFLLRAANYP
jgi:hypothetical protein